MSMKDWPGSVISNTPVVPAGPYQTGAASGIWSLDQAADYAKQGIWPIAGNTAPIVTTYGTVQTFAAGATGSTKIAIDDRRTTRFIVSYYNNAAANVGTMIAGDISGTTVTYGTAAVFNNDATYYGASPAYNKSDADKAVVLYCDVNSSAYGKSKTVTLSGTSLSFGSAATFNSAATYVSALEFDSIEDNTFAIAFKDSGNSDYGTAIIGTVDAAYTGITYGSKYVFNSASSTPSIDIAADPNTSYKFVIVYQGSGNQGKAVVATRSGTTISYGSVYTFDSGAIQDPKIDFDMLNSGKFIITFKDNTNSGYGTCIVGTISGTTLSFGTKAVYLSGSANAATISCDRSTAGQFVVAYQDHSDSDYGYTVRGFNDNDVITYQTPAKFNSASTQTPDVVFTADVAGKFVTAFADGQGKSVIGEIS